MRAMWQPGEPGARRQFDSILHSVVVNYKIARDRPATDGVSHLSPHLHFGEISPRTVWHSVADYARTTDSASASSNAHAFIRQLGWRDFAHHLLFHYPHTTNEPLDGKFAHFPWNHDNRALHQWQKGLTGYPLVDAGMRELWHTGWMHNRVRMVAALIFSEGSVAALARRSKLVLGHPGGCGSCQQHDGVAVGGRMRGRCGALLSNLQSDFAR